MYSGKNDKRIWLGSRQIKLMCCRPGGFVQYGAGIFGKRPATRFFRDVFTELYKSDSVSRRIPFSPSNRKVRKAGLSTSERAKTVGASSRIPEKSLGFIKGEKLLSYLNLIVVFK